jgi:hypothetical protein
MQPRSVPIPARLTWNLLRPASHGMIIVTSGSCLTFVKASSWFVCYRANVNDKGEPSQS